MKKFLFDSTRFYQLIVHFWPKVIVEKILNKESISFGYFKEYTNLEKATNFYNSKILDRLQETIEELHHKNLPKKHSHFIEHSENPNTKRKGDDDSLHQPPSKKMIITKDKISKICGLNEREKKLRWVLQLTDGSFVDIWGADLIQLQPIMFLNFVESCVIKGNKID